MKNNRDMLLALANAFTKQKGTKDLVDLVMTLTPLFEGDDLHRPNHNNRGRSQDKRNQSNRDRRPNPPAPKVAEVKEERKEDQNRPKCDN